MDAHERKTIKMVAGILNDLAHDDDDVNTVRRKCQFASEELRGLIDPRMSDDIFMKESK